MGDERGAGTLRLAAGHLDQPNPGGPSRGPQFRRVTIASLTATLKLRAGGDMRMVRFILCLALAACGVAAVPALAEPGRCDVDRAALLDQSVNTFDQAGWRDRGPHAFMLLVSDGDEAKCQQGRL